METRAQDVPGYYVWSVPGKPAAVHLRLDVVDRLAAEAMRGFGAVRKRGVEVGGVLLGTIQEGFPPLVRVEDFEPVACDYRLGPSYQLTAGDGAEFEDVCQRWQPAASPACYVVGFFRSHTREGFSLQAEDIELLDLRFPNPSHVALLIQPFATKASVAGFFIRENDEFPATSPLEFPLRRRELTGEEPLPRRAMAERQSYGDRDPEPASAAPSTRPAQKAAVRGRTEWVWIPLSFLALVLGAGLGYQIALSMSDRKAVTAGDDFSLALSVAQHDDNLSLTWDRRASAIRFAQKGVLEIEEGGNTKPVDLDASQLQNGTLLYRNSSDSVRFRLTVYPLARVSVTETLNWKR